MSDSEFTAYRKRLADFVYDYMEEVEKETGYHFSILIAHHAFLNPMVGKDVLQRRKIAGKPFCHLCVFVHGTALKMYVHEKGGANPEEYPMRFLPLIQSEDLFSKDSDLVTRIFAISNQQVTAFKDIFPDFADDKVTVSPNGINFDVFHCPDPPLTRDEVLGELKHIPYEGGPVDLPSGFDAMVMFVGKFANWKRLDSLLYAAESYEKYFEGKGQKVCTIIVGSGPPEAVEFYKKLELKDLKLQHCYFLGAQQQPICAKLYSVASVAVFPSKAEPFGLVFVESMSCKCPVIGANSGGPKDFVTPDVGHLVPEPGSYEPEDLKILAKDIEKAVVQAITEDWKSKKGDAGMKLARETICVKNQVMNILNDIPNTWEEETVECTC